MMSKKLILAALIATVAAATLTFSRRKIYYTQNRHAAK